jgi:hypothetical protein
MGQIDHTALELDQMLEGIHGALQITAASTAFTAGANDTPELYDLWEDLGESKNMTPSTTNDEIVASVAGTYRATFSCSFSITGGGSEVVKFHIYHDDGTPAKVGSGIHRTISSAGYGVASCSADVALALGDSIQVWVETSNATKTIVVSEADLFVSYLGA